MLRKTVGLILLSFLFAQANRIGQDSQPEPYNDPDAYDVYASILLSQGLERVAQVKKLVIKAETTSYRMCLKPEKEFEPIIGPAIAAYTELNKKPYLIQPDFSIDKPYEIIPASELKATFEKGGGGWKKFYEQHPDSGGSIDLSAVGFNADKTIAVVYMAHHCGGLCGEGVFYVLQKKDGKWIPFHWEGESCSWVS